MKSPSSVALAFIASLALVTGPGCSDGANTASDSGMPDVAQTDSAVVTDGADSDAPAAFDFVGLVEGFGESGVLKSDVTVEIFDNDTGVGTGVTAVSNAAGKVTFPQLVKGKLYGFKSTLANYKDTFVWNIKAGDYAEETLWIVSNTMFQVALGLSGLTAQPGKSMVAGAVYWVNGAGAEEAIGCVKVSTVPATPDVRYMDFNSGLPTDLGSQACTANDDTAGRGRFVAANLPVGQVTISATDSLSGDVGSTTLWSVADSVAVANVYATADITANPTPATCSCTP